VGRKEREGEVVNGGPRGDGGAEVEWKERSGSVSTVTTVGV
jgi:hypothetical protein